MDYVDLIAKNREGGVEHAATTPVFYERPARRRLTAARKRAKLLKSASDSKRAVKSRRSTKKSSSSRKSPKMASKKQKAAARRNIKKAQDAKRAKAAARSRAGKKAARTRKAKHSHKAARKVVKRTRKARKSSKRSRAAKKAARTRKANKAARKAARRRTRKAPKSYRKARKSAKRSRRSRKTRRSMSMKIPRKSRKVYVVAAERGRRRRGAMENPMTGVEIFVGSITGLAGFGLADFVDRMLATHALTDKNAKDANGQELYADNPPADGNYVGLFNPTAICAPMDWKRWVFGLLGAALPLSAAQLVSGPTARSALQFFGFGYGVRVVGKGLIDGLALLTKSTGMGQRLYDGEMRASVLKANNGNNQANELASLPAAGLGQPKALAGAPCKDCGDKQQTAPGAGYPSMPREVAPNAQPTSNATPPAPPPAPATPPAAFNPGPLTGMPKNGTSVKKNPYLWGEPIN